MIQSQGKDVPVKYDPGVAFLYAHLHAALMLSAAYLNKIQKINAHILSQTISSVQSIKIQNLHLSYWWSSTSRKYKTRICNLYLFNGNDHHNMNDKTIRRNLHIWTNYITITTGSPSRHISIPFSFLKTDGDTSPKVNLRSRKWLETRN